MNITDALKSISNYPIPTSTLADACEEAGLDGTQEADKETRSSAAFKKAKAQIYQFLSEAPNISQGGINYSFGTDERARFAKKATALMQEAGEEDNTDFEVGYIGEDF